MVVSFYALLLRLSWQPQVMVAVSCGTSAGNGLTQFHSQQEFEALGADWPTAKLVEIWNRIPGVAPVKKFTSRPTAIRRIWTLLESRIGPEHARPAPKRANPRGRL